MQNHRLRRVSRHSLKSRLNDSQRATKLRVTKSVFHIPRCDAAFVLTAWTAILLLVAPLNATPARPVLQEHRQPSGDKIELKLMGDEWLNWYETADGYTVIHRDDGNFVYVSDVTDGKIVPSDFLVGQIDPNEKGIRKYIYPEVIKKEWDDAYLSSGVTTATCSNMTFPSPIANFSNLVLLARFSNHTSRTLATAAEVEKIMNAAGGDPVVAPTGSFRDFYSENSYGISQPNSTVVDWITLPHTEQHYSEGRYGRGPLLRVNQAIEHALAAADTTIEFASLDSNGDGFADCVTFIHSGYGSEAGGDDADGTAPKDRIWSRYAQLDPPWVASDGTKVCRIAVCGGLFGNSGVAPVRIGLLCHEVGHVLRLPDLYDRLPNGITGRVGHGIGCWGVMGLCWGFDGSQLYPPHFSPYSKISLGWVTPTTIDLSGSFSIRAIEAHPDLFKITHGYPPGEYLLIENRQPIGFDQKIPVDKDGHGGLGIWHIDENQNSNLNRAGFPGHMHWPRYHYKVALLQADGEYHLEKGINQGNGTDLYRGTLHGFIGPATDPDTSAYQGGVLMASPNSVLNISPSNSTMTFDIHYQE